MEEAAAVSSRRSNKQPSFGIDILLMVGIVAVLALFYWMGTSPEQAKDLLGHESEMQPFWQRAIIVAIMFPAILWIYNRVRR